ncbi:MAG TPA: hypothetical protein VHU92_16100 [Streptosporangiaceae bacterium]|jgi:hypothetical protein|nr:hypothetical protein [Streptosporangiaceae bacterium]
MRHISDGVLRRLQEEPYAVPDAAGRHLETCGRCRASSGQIAEDAALASRMLAVPPVTEDTDAAWARLERQLEPGPAGRPAARAGGVPRFPRPLVNIPVLTGVGVTAVLVAGGVAAAATLTTVFSPTKVATVNISHGDLRAVSNVLGLGNGPGPGSLSNGNGNGTQPLRFGTLRWSSSGQPGQVSSVARATAQTHLAFRAPARLPAGVGSLAAVLVQPQATATITFSKGIAAPVGGTRLTVTAGPAMMVQYGGQLGGGKVPTLGILTMRRPVATSTGATTSQLENYLLSRRGMPADLARQVRLLGNLGSVLPIPVPPGATATHLRVHGAPAVLLSFASGAASAVIWESHDGTVHAVAGLLNTQDVLNVARQIG